MAEQLLIRLPNQEHGIVHWLVWSTFDKQIIASGELTNMSELSRLSEKAAQRQVIGLLPSNDVVLKTLDVPVKSKKAIHLAVPYMLEDELAQDVDSLVFAYCDEKMSKGNCAVAIIDRSKLENWLSQFNDNGISVAALIPEVLALPVSNDAWQAIMLEQQIIVRQGEWQGLSVDTALWSQLMPSWENNSEKPIIVDAYSTLPDTKTNVTVNQKPEELPLAVLAQHVNIKKFNMLQGEFKVNTEQSSLIKNWGWAAGIAIIAFLFTLAVNFVELYKLESQIAAVEKEIIDNYKRTFPNTKRVRISTLKSQLTRKLSGVSSTQSDTDFLHMLVKMEPAFSQVPSMKPDTIKYDAKRNELRMQATASSYQDFERFQNILKQYFTVSQGALNNQDSRISGAISLQLSSGGRS